MKSEFFLVILLASGMHSIPAPQAPSIQGIPNQFSNFISQVPSFVSQIPDRFGNFFTQIFPRPQTGSFFPVQQAQSNLPQIQTFQISNPQPQWPQFSQLPQWPQLFQFPFRQPNNNNNNNQGNGIVLPYFLPNWFNRPVPAVQNQVGQDPTTIIVITRPVLPEPQSLPPSAQSLPTSNESLNYTTNTTSTSEQSPIAEVHVSPVLVQNSSSPLNSTEGSADIGLTIVNEVLSPNSTVTSSNATLIDPVAIENV